MEKCKSGVFVLLYVNTPTAVWKKWVMLFRIILADEAPMYVLEHQGPLKAGDVFKLTGAEMQLRVLSIALDPVGDSEPEMLIGAERII